MHLLPWSHPTSAGFTLSDLVTSCHGDQRPDCPILKELETGCGCA